MKISNAIVGIDWTAGETRGLLPLLRITTVQWGKEVEREAANDCPDGQTAKSAL